MPAAVRRHRNSLEVAVVGAGPAGMQSAIAAARAGHDVDVYEAGESAGGQVRLAASVPSRAEFGDLIRNQLSEAERLGVRFHYGVDVDEELLRSWHCDVVVVATGSLPQRPWWAGDDPRVVDVRDVLTGKVSPSGPVLVVDELGFHQATSIAELLADRGCTVEVVTPGMVVGQDLGITLDMETWWMKATAKGIVQTTDTMVTGVSPNGDSGSSPARRVDLQQHTTGTELTRMVDWVVCAVPDQPADELWRAARRRLEPRVRVHRVGDCVAPRRAHAAVIEGERVGGAL
jgi:2,4-dienoyl-CoA reductase (NADPH2)